MATLRDGYFNGAFVMDLSFFDPNETVSVLERRLPHWSQAGVVVFITFRTHDSMPRDVLDRFHADRRLWLHSQGINPDQANWKIELAKLPRPMQRKYYQTFSTRWNDELDASHGQCVLRSKELSDIVADSLLHFDGDRYELTDFVVMPNHVHLLAAFPDDDTMLKQCESWKHYTATQINRRLGRRGRFWQQDGFDHLLRSLEQFEHLQRYIANNPKKANCQARTYSSLHAPP